jgi:hypothetical protein
MEKIQGFAGSHCTPLLGNYYFRFVLEASRATANKTMM